LLPNFLKTAEALQVRGLTDSYNVKRPEESATRGTGSRGSTPVRNVEVRNDTPPPEKRKRKSSSSADIAIPGAGPSERFHPNTQVRHLLLFLILAKMYGGKNKVMNEKALHKVANRKKYTCFKYKKKEKKSKLL